jgi:formylmethanofuran dehydrogenase subunit E
MKFRRPKNLNYRETVRFHGHDGPFLALGYRLGRFLNKELNPSGIMDFKISVSTKRRKPYTCLLDGLQCATFATLGKGNIAIRNISGEAIIVRVRKGGRVLKCSMTQRARVICFTAEDLEKGARQVLRTPIKQLWRIEK